jgi:hypothetical protein
MIFPKKFSDRWTIEAYIHVPGNEIGLVGQFWPNSVYYVKLEPNREVDVLLSVKHEIIKNAACLPDSTFMDFSKCIQTRVKEILLNANSSRMFCGVCQKSNASMCATISMQYFLEPGKELPFCNNTKSNRCSSQCFFNLIR